VKVGALVNEEYDIDMRHLKVSDFGNITVDSNKEDEDKQFKNVTTRKFKGEFVNYYKHSP
jgi:hypothetical protein